MWGLCWADVGPRTVCSFGARIQAQMNSPFLGHDDVGAMLGLLCWGLYWFMLGSLEAIRSLC